MTNNSKKIVAKQLNDDGTISKVQTSDGTILTRNQVVKEIERGQNFSTLNEHPHSANVVIYKDKFIKTVPTDKKCENLKELPDIKKPKK